MAKKNNGQKKGPKDLVGQMKAAAAAAPKPTIAELKMELRKIHAGGPDAMHTVNLRKVSDMVTQTGLVESIDHLREAVNTRLVEAKRSFKVSELHAYLTGANNPSQHVKADIASALVQECTSRLAARVTIIPESAFVPQRNAMRS